ncbi:unnamed protein product, partial [Ilex paraguariensis]
SQGLNNKVGACTKLYYEPRTAHQLQQSKQCSSTQTSTPVLKHCLASTTAPWAAQQRAPVAQIVVHSRKTSAPKPTQLH